MKTILNSIWSVLEAFGQARAYTETNMELVAIQIIIFGVIILVYMAQEFDK